MVDDEKKNVKKKSKEKECENCKDEKEKKRMKKNSESESRRRFHELFSFFPTEVGFPNGSKRNKAVYCT